jgi:hypothetical protein
MMHWLFVTMVILLGGMPIPTWRHAVLSRHSGALLFYNDLFLLWQLVASGVLVISGKCSAQRQFVFATWSCLVPSRHADISHVSVSFLRFCKAKPNKKYIFLKLSLLPMFPTVFHVCKVDFRK